jgi:hypothetical protein
MFAEDEQIMRIFHDRPLCVKAKGTYELLNNWLPIDACIELTGNRINLGTALEF